MDKETRKRINKNLIPFNELPPEKQKELRAKGGRATGAKKREKKKLREMLEVFLEKKTQDENGNTITTGEAVTLALIKKCLKGDVKAFEVLRDTIGQKPIEEVKNTQTVQVVNINKKDIENILKDIEDLGNEV